MSPADVLLAARDLIAEPEHWTKATAYRDARGRFAKTPEEAVRMCSVGAIGRARVALAATGREYDAAFFHLRAAMGCVAVFNDAPDTTHADVMDAFDRAIRLAKDADS